MTFEQLQLNSTLLKALAKNGFSEATDIQQQAIPAFLAKKNVFGKSSTGTGKTAAFVLPILNDIDAHARSIQAIIMAPTRELAMQIVNQIRIFSNGMNSLTVTPLIGGAQLRDQIKRLKQSQIVVGTPGRVNDHIQRKTLKLNDVKTIILDEADEMLKMGFKNEMDAIFEQVPNDVQVGLFSATVTPKVINIAKNYMEDYEMIQIENQIKVNNNIENTFIFTKGISKEELILKVFEKHEPQKVIIFSNTKSFTDKIAQNLKQLNLKSVVINGDKRQSERSRAVNKFKNNEVGILVATDVVARGIDITGVDYVINYDISRENEHFVHRIGRTGRNNSKGKSITFVQNMNTLHQLKDIAREFNLTIDEIECTEYGIAKNSAPSDRNRTRDGGRSRSYGGGRPSERSGSRNNGNGQRSEQSSSWGSSRSSSRSNGERSDRSSSWGAERNGSRPRSSSDRSSSKRTSSKSSSRSWN